ncbi:MAG: NAD(P)H-hydrate dehydratase, partial [Candidatus Subteraquimicrobiales bacterium]|nr:NAD(P)H-hydrate dehydratase [Candidatus Subteraquimicrobiales bacterium]
ASDAFKKLKKTPVKIVQLTEANLSSFDDFLGKADLVIDAIFGTGFSGEIKGFVGEIIKKISLSEVPVLSVDIPSGVNASNGRVSSICVKATKTVTFMTPKIGLIIYPGAAYTGEILLAELGASGLVKNKGIELITLERTAPLLPERKSDIHKKACGRVLVIAGSVGMTGAATLTSLSVLRSGAGLVTLGVPESLNDILEVKLTEVMTVPLRETKQRTLHYKALNQVLSLLPDFDVVILGPGLSTHSDTVSLVRELVEKIELPLVLDADGLNAIDDVKIFKKRKAPTIITPHPGELARLIGVSSREIQGDRVDFAKKSAKDWQVVIILKGARSVVSSPETALINMSGNSGMASAGTGDVLAGLVGGFLAQGLTPLDSAILSTYLHGLAGDIAAEKKTEYCLIAGDLIDYLPEAIKMLLEKKHLRRENG